MVLDRVINKNNNCVFNGPYAGRDLYITIMEDKEREFIVTHNADIKPVSYFTGRQNELDELRQRIEEGRKSVLVSGMGGIGKTHICRKLFNEYALRQEKSMFHHIGYIEYDGNMSSSLQKCLKYKKQENPEANKEAAWRELEYLASDGKLLLFVDNVNVSIGEDSDLKRLVNIPGAIVLTSRRTSFSNAFEPYRIGFLSTEQCREIYEKIRFENSGLKVKDEEVQELEYVIEKLAARHTITIEFLAKLAWTKCWTVKRLKEELEKNGFKLEYRDEEDILINIQKAYETLYDLSELTEGEQNILEAFSIFPHISLSARKCNEWLLSDAGIEQNEDILIGLYRKGWLQFDIEQESYSMHPVFSQFIYEKCKPKMKKHLGLMKSCQNCLEVPKNGFVLESEQYIWFAKNIIEKLQVEYTLEYAEFISTLAFLLQYLGRYIEAEIWYEDSVKIRELILGMDHLDITTEYDNLADMYYYQGRYEDSLKLYCRVLKIRKKAWGENHEDTARSYYNIACNCMYQKKYKQAERLFKHSLKISEKILDEEHQDVVKNYHNLGELYNLQGEYEKAEKLFRKCLAINIKTLGNHPDTAIVFSNLSCVYESQGNYKLAGLYSLKAHLIFLSKLGPWHRHTLLEFNHLIHIASCISGLSEDEIEHEIENEFKKYFE